MSTPYRLHPVSLSFPDADTEAGYRKQTLPTLTFFARTGCILASLMYLSFGILDIWIIPEHKETVWLIRLVVVACIVAVYFFSYTRAFGKYNQVSQLLAAGTGSLGLVVMVLLIPRESGYFYYPGIGIAIVFLYIILGLRFVNALALNLVLLVSYQVAVVIKDMPIHMIINNNYVLIGFSIVAATGGYIIERQRRYAYYQSEEMKTLIDQADAANEAKSRFLASMSHELRTPLNAIIGYSEMLAEEATELKNAEMAADLASIQGAGRHLLRLINNVLDLAKIEAGKFELNRQHLSVAELLDKIRFTATPLSEKNHNTLVITADSAPQNIYQDSLRLEQILLNLISNACKFTHDGEVRLEVGSSGEGVTFAVSDTGIGMSREQVDRLFEEYHQADSSIAGDYGGTGLGLAISRQLVELMGGTISVTSETGKGSSFLISIPDA